MYLSAKRYLSQYADQDKEVIAAVSSMPIQRGNLRPKEITYEAMYWRKSNAIHGWFVDNVQAGEDDCEEHYVSIEMLQELVALCLSVIKSRDPSMMPPTSGFFFGSTEVDDYYYEELESTARGLTKLLETPDIDDFTFHYRASW